MGSLQGTGLPACVFRFQTDAQPDSSDPVCPDLASVLVPSCIVACTALDAANNVPAIIGYDNIYFFAHSALSTANNVTGTIAGTGESLC